MRINSDASLKVAADTFERFDRDWTAVHRAAVLEDGILVIRAGALDEEGEAPSSPPPPKGH